MCDLRLKVLITPVAIASAERWVDRCDALWNGEKLIKKFLQCVSYEAFW